MLEGKTVAVVVPAYNEGSQIHLVIESMPEFVDRIVIINDKSEDNTSRKVSSFFQTKHNETDLRIESNLTHKLEQTLYNTADRVVHEENIREVEFFTKGNIVNSCDITERIILIDHLENSGVGAAIATGYKWCKDHDIDCTAVMAGDGQMDPDELGSICAPVINENIDYVKGNRLTHSSAWLLVPRVRFLGNAILGTLTKVASGYWHVSDTQTGYTAISRDALKSIKLYDIYQSYGMPNDILIKLNIASRNLREVRIKPVYNVGESSKMKIFRVIPRISWLLVKGFHNRLWNKYLFRDFHPLFILYNLGFVLSLCAVGYGAKISYIKLYEERPVSEATILAFIFLAISSFQALLFAMWMDIQDNERLNK